MSETEKDIRFELRSEEVHEILSFVPQWVVRWGISAIFLTTLTLLLASWIIRYPEIIVSRITITTETPPVSIVARSGGKLVKLFIQDNQYVSANQYLAAIENPAEIGHVVQLKHAMEEFQFASRKQSNAIMLDPNVRLGELQPHYANILRELDEYNFFSEANYYERKIRSVREQIILHRIHRSNLEKQKSTLLKEVELSEKTFGMQNSLFQQGVISQLDLDAIEGQYLEKKSDLENAEASLIQDDIQLAEFEKTILELTYEFEESKLAHEVQLREAKKNLDSQITIWEQKYVLRAPSEGYISFFKYWGEGQFVNANEEMMAVVPDSRGIIGEVYVPQLGSGKVKVGQNVNIKLDNYPFREFGVVKAKIESISLVPWDNRYLVRVSLPQGLQTTYKKHLELKQEMQGIAEIVTEDLRLMDRLFNQFRSLAN